MSSTSYHKSNYIRIKSQMEEIKVPNRWKEKSLQHLYMTYLSEM